MTQAPTAAPDPDPTAAPAPEPDQPDDQPAEQSEDDREGEAHGRPRRNEPTFDVDLDFGGEGGGDAGGDATIDHGCEGQIDSNIDLTVPSITLSDRDSITAARSSLNGSLASIIDGVSSLNTNTGSHTQALIQDVQAISSQLNKKLAIRWLVLQTRARTTTTCLKMFQTAIPMAIPKVKCSTA